MSNIQFIAQDPTRPTYSPRIKDWLEHEPLIRSLHGAGRKRQEILDTLKEQKSFRPSLSQLNGQMSRWKLKSYNKKDNPAGSSRADERLEQEPTSGASGVTPVPRINMEFNFPQASTATEEIDSISNQSSVAATHMNAHAPPLGMAADQDEAMVDDVSSTATATSDPVSNLPTLVDDNDDDDDDDDDDDEMRSTSTIASADNDEWLVNQGSLVISPSEERDEDVVIQLGAEQLLKDAKPYNLREKRSGIQYPEKTRREGQYTPSSSFTELWSAAVGSRPDLTTYELCEMGVVAGFLSAARLYQDAFDIHYLVLLHCSRAFDFPDQQLLTAIIGCARTCVTDEQTRQIVGVLEAALGWHYEHYRPGKSGVIALLHLYTGELLQRLGETEFDLHNLNAIKIALINEFELDDLHDSIRWREWTSMVMKVEKLSPWYIQRPSPVVSGKLEDLATTWTAVNPMEKLLKWCTRLFDENVAFLDASISPADASDREQRKRNTYFLYCFCIHSWLQQALPLSLAIWISVSKDSKPVCVAVPSFDAFAVLASLIFEKAFPLSVFGDASERRPTRGFGTGCVKSVAVLSNYHSSFGKTYVDSLVSQLISPPVEQGDNIDRSCVDLLHTTAHEMVSSSIFRESDPQLRISQSLETMLHHLSRKRGPPSLAETASMLSQSSGKRSVQMFLDMFKRTNLDGALFSTSNATTDSIAMSVESHDSWKFSIVTGMPSEFISEDEVMEIGS